MPMLIWTKSKDRLAPSMKKKAYAFLEKLQEDDKLPGLHIEPIKGAIDPRVRTGRVDEKYRCILFKLTSEKEPCYVIHGIWKHDVANHLAQNVRLSTNPINGIPQIETIYKGTGSQDRAPQGASLPPPQRVPETFHKKSSTTWSQSPNPPQMQGDPQEKALPHALRSPQWPAGATANILHNELGIDLDLANAALSAPTEDVLINDVISTARVDWQAEALLDLATGIKISEVKSALHLDRSFSPARKGKSEDENLLCSITEHPAAKSSFHLIDNNEELRRIIEEGDLGAWRLFLHPEQRTYAEGNRKGPFRLSGGAGTGKTVVTMHRAAYLARMNPSARILLTTFTRNLAEDLASGIRRLDGTLQLQNKLNQPGICVKGIDQVAWAVVQRAGNDIAQAAEAVLGRARTDVLAVSTPDLWREAIRDAGGELPKELATQAFLEVEYIQVVLPNRITTCAAYLAIKRTGRGVALDRTKRIAVWKVFEAYRDKAHAAGSTSYPEKAALAASWLEMREIRPFDHVIVDEAQDLCISRLKLLRSLTPEGVNDLFICEDSHQRIYGQKVVLSHCGINVRGRARHLTLNYRTTQQNLSWAMQILSGADWSDLEGAEEKHRYHSVRKGPRPLLLPAATFTEEVDKVAEVVRSWLPNGQSDSSEVSFGRAARPEDIAILVRDQYRKQSLEKALRKRNLDVRSVDRDTPQPGKPLVMTMHRAKGLEFTHVLLFGITENSIPRAINDYKTSEADYTDALLRERALLYVASTRARDVFAVSWSGRRSPLL